MAQVTTTHTNIPRRAHPAVVRAALRSRSRHAYARVTEACDAITYPDGVTYNYTYDTESGRVAAQQRGTHRPTPCGCNRLIEVRDASNALIVNYTYDPFGRRLSKTVVNNGISTTQYFFYSAAGLIAEADALGQITRSYGYAPKSRYTTNPLFTKVGNNYYYYQNDHLGTPMKLLNQSGLAVWSATYDAFGKATVDPSSIISNNLRFPGQYADAETGLHNNWHRYYDPMTGRYITSDPIGLLGGMNLYTYVMGNPLLRADILGLIATLSDEECAKLERDIGLEKDTIKKLKQMMEEGKSFEYYGLTAHADSDGYVSDIAKTKSQTYQTLVNRLENDKARTRSDKINRIVAIIITQSINKGSATVEKNRSETILHDMENIFNTQCTKCQK